MIYSFLTLKFNIDFMIEFIREKALRLAQESKKKLEKSSSKKGNLRPISSQPYYSRPFSGFNQ